MGLFDQLGIGGSPEGILVFFARSCITFSRG